MHKVHWEVFFIWYIYQQNVFNSAKIICQFKSGVNFQFQKKLSRRRASYAINNVNVLGK